MWGAAQTFSQRLHNSYAYFANAAADYILLRPIVRTAWCALHAPVMLGTLSRPVIITHAKSGLRSRSPGPLHASTK